MLPPSVPLLLLSRFRKLCQILAPFPGSAAQLQAALFCATLSGGADSSRPIGTAAPALPGVRGKALSPPGLPVPAQVKIGPIVPYYRSYITNYIHVPRSSAATVGFLD